MCKDFYEAHEDEFFAEQNLNPYEDMLPKQSIAVPNIHMACENGLAYLQPFIPEIPQE